MEEPQPTAKVVGKPSPLLGVLVMWPTVLLFWSPVWLTAAGVVAWGLVYALVPRRAARWPWWILGQWLTLTAVFSLEYSRMDGGLDAIAVGAGAIFALIASVIWMMPVVIAEVHRTQWHTKRPAVDGAERFAVADTDCTEPSTSG